MSVTCSQRLANSAKRKCRKNEALIVIHPYSRRCTYDVRLLTFGTSEFAFISVTRERNSDLVRPFDIRLHRLLMPVIPLLTFLLAQNTLLAV